MSFVLSISGGIDMRDKNRIFGQETMTSDALTSMPNGVVGKLKVYRYQSVIAIISKL